MNRKKILLISGSLRKNSFNTQLAKEAYNILKNKADVDLLILNDVPILNQDEEFPAPEIITKLRKQLDCSDGVWIFIPEYNKSYPPIVKNYFDWMSRPEEKGIVGRSKIIDKKPITLSGAGGARKTSASRESIMEVLDFIGMKVMRENQAGYHLPPEVFKEDVWKLKKEDIELLKNQAEEFLKFI